MGILTLMDRRLITPGATVSGGSWVNTSSIKLSNVLQGQPKKIARSTDLALASTTFTIDNLVPTPLSLLAFVNHNFSRSSTIRIRTYNAGDLSPTIDATIPGRQPDVPFGSLAWGDPDYAWDGISGRVPSGGLITTYQHPSIAFNAKITVDISDPDNAAGYVQQGPFLYGYGFTSAINMNWGANIKFIDESRSDRADAGDLWFDEKPKRRRLTANLEWLTPQEGTGRAYQLCEYNGITRGVLAIYDPDDEAGIKARRTIYGTMVSLGDITDARPGDKPQSWPVQIEEMT
jgi:hypothetical protein